MDIKKVEQKINKDKENPWIEVLCTEFAKAGYGVAINGKRIDLNKFGDDAYHKLYDMRKLPLKLEVKSKATKGLFLKVLIDNRNRYQIVKTRS